MGAATFCIGLLPSYASIGVAAPILLVVLRFVQGFAIGGEWGGAILMAAEHGGAKRRGLFASWPQAGVPIGNLLAVGVVSLLGLLTSAAAFEAWGWRVAFLLSAVLVGVGLWVRATLAESPEFEALEQRAETVRTPIVEVVRRHPRSVLVAMGARFAENVSYYIFTVFVLTYVTEELGLERSWALNAVLIASAVHLLAIPAWGALSDRVGRRPLYVFGAVGVGVWGFVFFALLDTASFAAITLAIAVGLVLHAAMYGPQAAFFSEMFGTGVRYSGVSIGYQLASVFAGSLAPIVAVALLAEYGSALPISFYLAGMAVITLVALAFAREARADDEPAVPLRPARFEREPEYDTVGR